MNVVRRQDGRVYEQKNSATKIFFFKSSVVKNYDLDVTNWKIANIKAPTTDSDTRQRTVISFRRLLAV